MRLASVNIPEWDGSPREAGEAWTLRKDAHAASCHFWTRVILRLARMYVPVGVRVAPPNPDVITKYLRTCSGIFVDLDLQASGAAGSKERRRRSRILRVF